jgi:hypothetical protein
MLVNLSCVNYRFLLILRRVWQILCLSYVSVQLARKTFAMQKLRPPFTVGGNDTEMLATTHILPYDGICICHTDQALLYRLDAGNCTCQTYKTSLPLQGARPDRLALADALVTLKEYCLAMAVML